MSERYSVGLNPPLAPSFSSIDETRIRTADLLYSTTNGYGLLEVDKVASVHIWVTDGFCLLLESDFINLLKVHGNLYPTHKLENRCKPGRDPVCPYLHCKFKGYYKATGHLIQQCGDMWGMLIKRHDSIIKMSTPPTRTPCQHHLLTTLWWEAKQDRSVVCSVKSTHVC